MFRDSFAEERRIIRSHAPADAFIIHHLRQFGSSPLVLVRDIFESLESIVDHIGLAGDETGEGAALQSDSRRGQAFGFSGDATQDLDNAIISFARLYVDFFAQWIRAQRILKNAVLNYELLKRSEPVFMRTVLEALGHPWSDRRYEQTVDRLEQVRRQDRRRLRMNKLGQGRGIENFTDAQIDLVRGLYRMYPEIDFRMIDRHL